jgi:hypothetical protein
MADADAGGTIPALTRAGPVGLNRREGPPKYR